LAHIHLLLLEDGPLWIHVLDLPLAFEVLLLAEVVVLFVVGDRRRVGSSLKVKLFV